MMKPLNLASLLAITTVASGILPVVDLGYEKHRAITYNVSSHPSITKG